MPQDFWASTAFPLLERRAEGLAPTDAWLAELLHREELAPPPEAGTGERALHARLLEAPRAPVGEGELDMVEDREARDNWREFLRFRDRLLQHATLEDCYVELFRKPAVEVAPVFVDFLAQAIVRAILDGTEDAFLCRAGELFFRLQRVSTEGGRVLAADAETLERFAETGGFGRLGKLLRSGLPEVKMDVLSRENAPLYFLRDELHSFVLDLTPGSEGANALARLLAAWVRRLAGTSVTIEPAGAIHDERWRWHVGLDAAATEILDALYRGGNLEASVRERLLLLFRLAFDDPLDALAEMAGRPVYLGLAARPDRTLRMKPQNLLANLPLAGRVPRAR